MSYPWQGRAKRLRDSAFDEAARSIGCAPDVIRAVWQVECSGRPFRSDGSLTRRYEPHHMPGSGVTSWRVSLRMSQRKREAAFMDAYKRDPEAALRATSVGGPQIMGFNHDAAGYRTALEMVEAMADDEAAHLTAFLTLAQSWGMASDFRAKDWRRIARRWNGTGQVERYAAKMESAYRSLSGRPSPVVLRAGSRGAEVRRLQEALGLEADGYFGPRTEKAVRAVQAEHGLVVDGVVGAITWAALESPAHPRSVVAPTKPDEVDRVAQITGYAGAATAVGGAVVTVGDALPDQALTILAGGAVAAGLLGLVAWLFTKARRRA